MILPFAAGAGSIAKYLTLFANIPHRISLGTILFYKM